MNLKWCKYNTNNSITVQKMLNFLDTATTQQSKLGWNKWDRCIHVKGTVTVAGVQEAEKNNV